MYNNVPFRIAFLLSVSVHLIAVSAGGFFQGAPPPEENREVVVAYLMPEAPEDAINEEIIENLPREYDLRDKELRQNNREKAIVEAGSVKADGELAEDQYLEEKELEKLEEYIQYYELIREKIKKLVARNYATSREEGAVRVAFTLDKNGRLKDLLINKPRSVNITALHKAAIRSVRGAAPFPVFPPSVKRNDLTFNLAIIFKKK